MANPNPHKARRARHTKKLQRAGNIEEVRERLWRAVEAASEIVDDGETDKAVRLRAVHAVTQSTTAYVKLLEASEFEARLQALEKALGEQ